MSLQSAWTAVSLAVDEQLRSPGESDRSLEKAALAYGKLICQPEEIREVLALLGHGLDALFIRVADQHDETIRAAAKRFLAS